jgi:hypothetical protein
MAVPKLTLYLRSVQRVAAPAAAVLLLAGGLLLGSAPAQAGCPTTAHTRQNYVVTESRPTFWDRVAAERVLDQARRRESRR